MSAHNRFFHIRYDHGRQSLRDPAGRPFFILGVNHVDEVVGSGTGTLFQERFGGDWVAYGRQAESDLRTLGFNCCGYAAPAVLHDRIPFFQAVQVLSHALYHAPGTTGYDDVFDPAFARRLEETVQRRCAEVAGNPNLIGYFGSDLPPWDLERDRRANGRHWMDWWRGLPEGSPGQQVYRDFLRESPGRPQEEADRLFMVRIARRYMDLMTAAFRRHGGGHLLFGDRFKINDLPDELVPVLTGPVDAVSVQPGSEPVTGDEERIFPRERLAALHRLSGKPLLICDHQCSFFTEATPRTLWYQFPDQVAAGRHYRDYLAQCRATPFLFGYLRCMYVGRAMSDGCWKQGLLDPRGELHEPFVSMVATTNRRTVSKSVSVPVTNSIAWNPERVQSQTGARRSHESAHQ